MKRLAFGLLLVAAAGTALWLWRGRSAGLGAVEASIRQQHPDVATLSTDRLASRLTSGEAPLLLDAREPAEYAVSHLPGAIQIDPDARGAALDSALAALPADREIVVYCSVGARSAGLAERIQAQSDREVANLEGSIFRWANEGRPLANSDGPTTLVHPYSASWGQLLDPDRRAPLAP